jgi:pimeloyl-ACP methyl ester carboxylesterase
MQTQEHWVELPQGRLFARSRVPEAAEAGRAAILLFHDSLGCVALWRDFPERLAEVTGRRVVAYDRLGFGRSDPHPGPLAPDFITAEATGSVPALCAQLGLEALVPFGHSVGGAMAVAVAARWPERCSAVITMAAQAFVEDRTTAGVREARDAFRAPGQIERLARHHGTKARWVLESWTGTWLSPRFAGWTLDADLACIRCPLLALHGDRDEYGSRRHPERIVAHAGGPAAMEIIADCGHLPHREQPEAAIRAVARFLAA